VDALGIVGYLAAHLCLFLVWLRRVALFRREPAIAAYHLVSYAMLVGTLGAMAILGRDARGFALAGLAAGLHGIYSLTFLELWSLTEGSYSLSLLMKIDSSETAVTVDELVALKSIGATKRSVRLESLRRLGLVSEGPAYRVTFLGRVCSAALSGVIWLSNGQTTH
jgi:hypothetical protein